MASEEKYLWAFTYQLHGTDYIWWAYFRDRQEAEAEIGALQASFPCLQARSLQEERSGLMFAHYYYHHACSSQRRADRLLPEKARKRDKWLIPLAPITCDYTTSFLRSLGHGVCCEACADRLRTLKRGIQSGQKEVPV